VELAQLERATAFTDPEIKEWFRCFSLQCPNGRMDQETVVALYSRVLPTGNARTFVDQLFKDFDKDGNGLIDFQEFMLALDVTLGSSVEEKLMSAFRILDRDKSGTISLKEMVEVIGTFYTMEGHREVSTELLQAAHVFLCSVGRVFTL
jgi:Ca2+-binding EF-hand superfamily protein